MDKEYRINLRFNLEKQEDKMIADYLMKLSTVSRNRFIRDAILKQIQRRDFSLEDIRAMFRDELKSISVTAPAEEEPQIDSQVVQNLLDDLKMFN